MRPIPETEKNYLVLLNKSSLDLVRAVEREKLRRAFVRAVLKYGRKWEPIVRLFKTEWPRRQAAFFRN